MESRSGQILVLDALVVPWIHLDAGLLGEEATVNWIVFTLLLELVAFAPVTQDSAFSSTLEMGALAFERIGVSTSIETEMLMDTALSYNPYLVTYEIDGWLQWGGLRAGVRHACVHPVESNLLIDEMYSASSRTEFYARLELSLK